MSNLSVFLAGNNVIEETTKVVVSNRYKADGKAVEWELKPVDSDTDEMLRKECTKKVPIAGKRGQYTMEHDSDKYMNKLCVKCVVFPNLNDAELQDSYKVKSAEALLKKLLLPGEYLELKAMVMEINGFDVSMEDRIDEAKN
jgi:hypothetical protein